MNFVTLLFFARLKFRLNPQDFPRTCENQMSRENRPFPSSLVPLFQSESKCETILMKMTLICIKMKKHAELIFI